MSFPTDIKLQYVPITKENKSVLSCTGPTQLDLSKELPGKKVVVTAAPGAFTPACTEQHIPNYLQHLNDFKAKGVDRIIVLTANDPFVNAAWGKALGNTDDSNYVIFASDINAELSKKLGDEYAADMSKAGLGIRTGRYAAIVDDGKITYLGNEDTLGFTEISSAKTLLNKF